MTVSRLFADGLYDAMRNAWVSYQARRGVGREPFPGASVIAALIDPAFRASLQREEGREVRCSVMLCAPTMNPLPTATPTLGHTFTFSEPLPYSDRTLRKLAGAYDASNAVLLIDIPMEGEPRIWGFGYYGSAHFREPSLAIGTGYEVSWPDQPIVRIDSPGRLFLTCGDAMIGALENGEFYTSIPTPLYSRAMGNLLIDAISGDPGYVAHRVHYWHAYNRILEHLLRRVNQISHGATIILVPSGRKKEILSKFHGGFTPGGSFQIGELIIRRLESEKENYLLWAGLGPRLYERINSIAQLACLDGALILTTDFEVISFGARLHSPEWNGPVITGSDGVSQNGEPFDLKRHGTRHNSAAALVGECDFVIAFVSSADGPIRGIAKDVTRNCLCCWPDFRASRFLNG